MKFGTALFSSFYGKNIFYGNFDVFLKNEQKLKFMGEIWANPNFRSNLTAVRW